MESIEIQEESKKVNIHDLENWSEITAERVEELIRKNKDLSLGYLIWTKPSFGKDKITEHIEALKAREISHLRTGLSWAEWQDRDLRKSIVFYLHEYAKHFTVLPCLTFTPPELGIHALVNSPPKNPLAYADFVRDVLESVGGLFTEVELWNEWNLETDWDKALDPNFEIFMEMIAGGARVAHEFGKKTVLGGMSRVGENTMQTLRYFAEHLRDSIDVVGFHNLRGTWSDQNPSKSLEKQRQDIVRAWGKDVPVYLSEYGFPVVDPEERFEESYLEDIQVALFAYAVYGTLTGAVDRAYWFTYKDHVSPSLRFVTTGWEDVLQHYYGDTREDGSLRKLGRLLLDGGPYHVLRYAVEHSLMPLVDAASLGRQLPKEKVA